MTDKVILSPSEVFKARDAKSTVDEIVKEHLESITEFSIEGSKEWSQNIGNNVKEKLKEIGKDPNYKY